MPIDLETLEKDIQGSEGQEENNWYSYKNIEGLSKICAIGSFTVNDHLSKVDPFTNMFSFK